jgi:hypothetical protein
LYNIRRGAIFTGMIKKGVMYIGSELTNEITVLFHKKKSNLGVMYDSNGEVMEVVFSYEDENGEIKECHLEPD